MHLSDFDYALPRELIAQYPPQVRGESRLLVAHRITGSIEHRVFSDIVRYLEPPDALIINDTKVLSCRLLGRRPSGGKVEVFLLQHAGAGIFRAYIRPGRVKTGEVIGFSRGLRGTVCGKHEIRFDTADPGEIYRAGEVPLPPYIKRPVEESDRERYQTVYACRSGAVAAPTAGLHFTQGLLQQLRSAGVHVGTVTLHTGPGTFQPVQTENIDEHPMEAESFEIPPETRALLEATRQRCGRIVAVGTTSARSLETYAATGSAQGETALFIRPGYRFRMCDALLTNFHLPRTTLLMLVHAFCGSALARRAYEEAIAERYRFYSYGDAMLIL